MMASKVGSVGVFALIAGCLVAALGLIWGFDWRIGASLAAGAVAVLAVAIYMSQ